MAEHYTSTTATEAEMRADLGLDVAPADADATQTGATALSTTEPASKDGDDHQDQAATQPAADDEGVADQDGAAEPVPPKPAKAADGDESISARVDKRIAKLVKEREAEREARAALEARLAALEQATKPKPEPAKTEPATPEPPAAEPEDREPTLEDENIVDVADFEKKHREWDERRIERTVQAALKADREAREKADREAKEAAELKEAETALNQRLDAFKAEHEDYDDVVKTVDQWTQPMVGAITTHEQGIPLAYHLATHPEERSRIAALTPGQQLLELGRVMERLTAAPKPTPTPPKPRVSNAPPPIAGVAGVTATATPEITDDTPYADLEKQWEADLRRKAGQ